MSIDEAWEAPSLNWVHDNTPKKKNILSEEEYQSLSVYFGNIFSDDDINVIADEVLQQAANSGRYRLACEKYPRGEWKFNFHPETGAWLTSDKQNTIIQRLKDVVKEKYGKLSVFFKDHFTADDVKSIARKVHQLGQEKNRYYEACRNYQKKPDCTLKFNFHPETGAWLGLPAENTAIGRLKKAVSEHKKKLEMQEKNDRLIQTNISKKALQQQVASLLRENTFHGQRVKRCNKKVRQFKKKVRQFSRLQCENATHKQVIVSTYTHLCDDTQTLTPHITLDYPRLGQGEHRPIPANTCLERQS